MSRPFVGRLAKGQRRWGQLAGLLSASLLALPSLALEAAQLLPTAQVPAVGDCVVFREGGAGVLLKAPSYWMQGRIVALSPHKKMLERCPQIGKLPQAYTREDWRRVAEASPCAERDDAVREVMLARLTVAVEEWDTPWSKQHGAAGWLYRGNFLDTRLEKGVLIEMDSTWVERCKAPL